MVAVIKAGHSMHRIFNYNENKVKEGVAECIGAENYPLDAGDMSVKMKLNFLLKRIELNENVRRNSVHISLNFDTSETGMSKEKMMDIAKVYMEKLGFGKQPYLVYQHHDAGHPHLHLVTTNIQSDGSTINLHHLGIRKSEPARKEIEKMFGLVEAHSRQKKEVFQLKPVDVRKVQYGRTDTRRAITNVLDAVLEKYRYTSLPELNAVLRQYNVMADRGNENSRVFKSGGLVYRVLDEQGNPIGVPIKASDIYSKPVLKSLEKKYAGNETGRLPHKARVKNAVDMVLLGRKALPIDKLVEALKKQGIDTVLRRNEEGLLYGITYVDHRTHCVFNGSALGKQYSAKAIQERCLPQSFPGQDLRPLHPDRERDTGLQPQHTAAETNASEKALQPAATINAPGNALEVLLQPEQAGDYVAAQLKRKRKKKKKKNLSNNQ
ncbi:relaxase/mobilization nuclease domain-containing protein [Chitinophaga defluvii]|uniref:Relaxase/mobilization nuclease domain-containing protein n=1 Tax=Chitinophaga defluvii TaxID=3163343 RepID=A0ABV2T6P6_9BACT